MRAARAISFDVELDLEEYIPVAEMEDEIRQTPSLILLRGLRTRAMELLSTSDRAVQRIDPCQALINLAVQLVSCVRAEIMLPAETLSAIRERSIAFFKTIGKDADAFPHPFPLWGALPIRHRRIWHQKLSNAILALSWEAKDLITSAGFPVEGLKAVNDILACIRDLFLWPTSDLYGANTSKRTAARTGLSSTNKRCGDAKAKADQMTDAFEKFMDYDDNVVFYAVETLMSLGKLANEHAGKRKPSCRLEFDDGSKTITLDEKILGNSLKPEQYQFMKAIEDSIEQGIWVSGERIKRLPGLTGKKLSRIFTALPPALKKLVRSKSGAGYRIVLPLQPKYM